MSSIRPRYRLLVAALVGACGLVFTAAPGGTAATPTARHAATSTRTDGITNVLADYDNEIREAKPRADGITHVDTPATIAKLTKAHVNTYAFLIWHQKTDWNDLVNEFLPAAQAAQINVWVYLVPPSECCSEPYEKDYIAWAKAIATVSLRFRNLTAWVIDDFAGNARTFTPAYMGSMQAAAHAVNPTLDLFTILYRGQYSADFIDAYAPYIDGAIFPYTGGAGGDLNDTSKLTADLDTASAALRSRGKRLYLMPYAAPYSGSPFPPSGATVASMIHTGLSYLHQGKLDGIVLYAMAKQLAVEPCPPDNVTDMLALSVPSATHTPGGDHVDASQQVAVDPAQSYSLTFQENDTFKVYPADEGYYDKELLVNGTVVWHQDPATDPASQWVTHTVDLTAALTGTSSATIDFRFSNPKGVSNFGITFNVADVRGQGFTVADGDFTGHDGWSFASTSDLMHAAYQSYTCDPQRQLHVYQAAQHGYGPDSLVYRSEAATGVAPGARTALITLARKALRQHEAGHDATAAATTDGLARLAGGLRLPILAGQAAAVATELRG